ncbi:MAG: hypothetical protein SGI87_10980 [Flavobacteriales bacterium]|nr:hypothetical protein [Flavobacteriales bacterium]
MTDPIPSIPSQHADRNQSRQRTTATDAKDILGQENPINHSSSPSASLGDLCVFAVKNSSMAIRGIDFNFGNEPANSFTQDQHSHLLVDFVMALPSSAPRSHPRSHPADRPTGSINPPFNIKEWWDGKLVVIH